VDARIHYPKVATPDLLLAMTQEALNKYGPDLKEDGLLIIDSTFVRDVPAHYKQVHAVPITQLAKDKCGRELFANIVALGTIAKLTDTVGLTALEQAVLARVPKGTEEMNRLALQTGYQAV